jgi:hypothetical protein
MSRSFLKIDGFQLTPHILSVRQYCCTTVVKQGKQRHTNTIISVRQLGLRGSTSATPNPAKGHDPELHHPPLTLHYLCKIHLNVILSSPRTDKWYRPTGFHTKILCAFFVPPTPVKCTGHLILLDVSISNNPQCPA